MEAKTETRVSRITGRIAGLATGRTLLVAAALFVPLAAWLFAAVIPATTAACGAAPPDMRASYDGAAVTAFLSECGGEGVDAYRTLQIVDLAYPAVSALFLFAAIAVVMRGIAGPKSPAALLSAVPVVGGLADYVENAVAWMYLTGSPSSAWGDLMGLAATVKTVAGWIAGLALVTGLLILTTRRAIRATRRTPLPA